MTRQLDIHAEKLTAKRHEAIVRAVEFDLEGSVAHAGGVLTGFSIKITADSYLMTVRAIVAGHQQVSFVGSDSLAAVICRAVSEAKADKLKWRMDKYANREV